MSSHDGIFERSQDQNKDRNKIQLCHWQSENAMSASSSLGLQQVQNWGTSKKYECSAQSLLGFNPSVSFTARKSHAKSLKYDRLNFFCIITPLPILQGLVLEIIIKKKKKSRTTLKEGHMKQEALLKELS